jgi:DNA-binding NtrC family response regulator
MIEATLKKCDGDRPKTATLLGTTVRTLYRREAEWRSDDA